MHKVDTYVLFLGWKKRSCTIHSHNRPFCDITECACPLTQNSKFHRKAFVLLIDCLGIRLLSVLCGHIA
jgi:hypothetical protein